MPLPIERYRAMRYISSAIVFFSFIMVLFLWLNNQENRPYCRPLCCDVCLSLDSRYIILKLYLNQSAASRSGIFYPLSFTYCRRRCAVCRKCRSTSFCCEVGRRGASELSLSFDSAKVGRKMAANKQNRPITRFFNGIKTNLRSQSDKKRYNYHHCSPRFIRRKCISSV